MKTSPYFEDLVNKIRKGDVIFWVGSGFSKTSGFLLGSELVEHIKKQVKNCDIVYFETKNNLDDVAEEFIQLYHREKLEKVLTDEFGKEPITLRYQQLVERIPQVTKIITTNYDKCFELAYGDKLCKIVQDTDIVKCSKLTKVNLYKIHGDVEYPDKIVISESDYANFYKKERGNLLWNVIRSLITKYSILFIGYSFEDTNVKLIFEDILERLGDIHQDYFLISTAVPFHKQTNLKEKYSIKYIDISVEKAIPKIQRVIEKNLIKDIENGNIKQPFSNLALKERNIDADFTFNPDGTLNIKSIKGSSKIEGRISYKVSNENFDDITELQNLIEGREFGELTLSSTKGNIEFWTQIGDSTLIDTKFAKKVEITIKSQPRKKIKSDLTLKDSDLSLEGLTGEHYYSQHAFKLDIHYIGFEISISGDKSGYKIFKFLNEWINGKNLQINFDVIEKPLVIPINHVELHQKHINLLKWNYNLFSGLFKIQQKFGIIFHKFSHISKVDFENIITIQKLLDGEKVKIDPIKCTFKPIDYDMFLKILDGDSEVFKIEKIAFPFKVLDKDVRLENCSVIINDISYLNKDEIKSQIVERKEFINVIIGSKSGNLFMIYDFDQ